METYSLLRQFADSWHLLFMFCFFVGIWIWVFRPSARDAYNDAAHIALRHSDSPISGDDEKEATR